MGPRRQGLPIRHRPRGGLARRPLPGAVAASRLSLPCSDRTIRPAAIPVRRSPTVLTGSPCTSPTTTSCSGRYPARRFRSCRRSSSGWDGAFPWVSSQGQATSIHDFNVSATEEQQRNGGAEYTTVAAATRSRRRRFRQSLAERSQGRRRACRGVARERPGLRFVRENGVVYHTYSTYARGLDGIWGMYQWLDRAPKGRNEQGVWWRHHDSYGQAAQ